MGPLRHAWRYSGRMPQLLQTMLSLREVVRRAGWVATQRNEKRILQATENKPLASSCTQALSLPVRKGPSPNGGNDACPLPAQALGLPFRQRQPQSKPGLTDHL